MMSPEEKAMHAYAEDDMVGLLMGKWPYFEGPAPMAPTVVPTNWERILQGLSSASESLPDLSARLNTALATMTGTAESAYCALEVVLHYLDARQSLSPHLVVDWSSVIQRVKDALPALVEESQSMHLDWMGPTDETLLDRLNTIRRVLNQAHGLSF